MVDFCVSSSEYREKFSWDGNSVPLYCLFNVTWSNGYERLYSITRRSDGKYCLVDFEDFHQRDQHYSTFERARSGMLHKVRKISKKLEVA